MSSATVPDEDRTDFELDPDSPLGALAERRAKKGQDLSIIVTDYHNRRGTGKTVLSLKLAAALNRSGESLSSDHVFLDPEAFQNHYTDLPKKSPLVLDEAEKDLNKYNAASSVSRAMREVMSMGRVEEKYAIVNLPASQHISDDLKALFDVWILVQARGEALVHFLRGQPYSGRTLTKKRQRLEWSDVPDGHHIRRVYREITEEKISHLKGGDSGDWVPEDEVTERIEKARENAARETRDEIVRSLYQRTDLEQSQIAAALPDEIRVSQSAISKIVNQ